MQVFVFRSQTDTSVVGYTTRRGGGNLSAEFAPWLLLERVSMLPGMPVAGVRGGADVVIEAIRRDGFFLARSEDVAT